METKSDGAVPADEGRAEDSYDSAVNEFARTARRASSSAFRAVQLTAEEALAALDEAQREGRAG